MNGTQTFNVNAAECLRDVAQFGSTQVHNICSGTVTMVPWGLGEWATVAALAFAALLVVGLFALLFYVARS